MTKQYTPQATLEYVTFLKRAVIESLQGAFTGHPDRTVAATKVALDFTHDRFKLPAVIVKYQETQINNIGVGHQEYLVSPEDPDPSNPTLFVKYYQRLYKGSLSFEIWAQRATDRDILRDALIEILGMWDTTQAGENMLLRLYGANPYDDLDIELDPGVDTPYGDWHFPVLNLDIIEGGPEQVQIAPWTPEDELVYTVTYKVPVMGEFYSITPTTPPRGLLTEVDVYDWVPGYDPPPQDVDISAYHHFTGWKSTSTFFGSG